jgi:hypothetical protein
MTNLEQIKNLKQLLENGAAYTRKRDISKDTSVSYNFLNAMLNLKMLTINEHGLYVWSKETEPTMATYKAILREAKNDRQSRPFRKNDKAVVTPIPNGFMVRIEAGHAVIEHNGTEVRTKDLDLLERVMKILS